MPRSSRLIALARIGAITMDANEIVELLAKGREWCQWQARRLGCHAWEIEQALNHFEPEDIEDMDGPADLARTALESAGPRIETLH